MKSPMKKLLAMVLALAMVLSLLPGSALTVNAAEQPEEPTDLTLLEQQMKEALASADERTYAEDYVAPEAVDPNEVIRVIVELENQPALSRMESGNVTLASAQQSTLNSQEATIQAISRELKAEPVHRMSLTSSAVSYEVRRSDMEKLAQLPGIRSVTEARQYQPQMFSAKEMAGVYEAWKMGETGYTGKGMAIAVIDSGVNYLHQDMTQNPETAKYTRDEMATKIQSLGRGEWFSDKVPFGYSYVAGHEYIVSQAQPHGHHVAGIAAANSKRDDIDGVAPDAQVYAMQVYDPLTGGGGYSDDIICAIEDAVALGADAINLSLGTNAGFYGSDRYMLRAVDAAEAAGVFVAVAAGNSGNSGDSYIADDTITNDWGISDTGLISDPATAVGATSVASIDGHGFIAYRFSITVDGEERKIDCNPISTLNFDFPDGVGFVDGGSIKNIQATAETAKGKVVLLSMDPKTTSSGMYYTVAYNIRSMGGVGVILYSEENNLSKAMSALREPYYSIPMAYVVRDDAQYMLGLAESGTTAVTTPYERSIIFATEPGVNRASVFTSWGPTPTLEIKPEIAAPGGSIFSVGDGTNSYYIMSGTSMASPFIAGSAAVVKQALAEANLDVENPADFIRKSLMNTADTVLETNFDQIASVRQVGAGMVNVKDAVENRVLATYHGKAAVELLDNLAAKTTGTIELKNYGDQAVTYTLSATDVFTDTTDADTKLYHNIVLEGAKVTFSAASVTVPANGTASFDFTLTIGAPVEGHFAEGYLQLASETAPDLSLPFLGFMGDWDDGTIIDAPTYEENTVTTRPSYGYYGAAQYGTCLFNQSQEPLGEVYAVMPLSNYGHGYIDPERIAISPNGDSINDVAIPWLSMLRNGQEVRMEVLDQNGKVIATPGSVSNLRKITANDDALDVDGVLMHDTDHLVGWDGTIFDPSTSTWNVAPEGNYTVRISSRVREGGAWQTVELPLKIDLTAPVISDLKVTIQDNRYVTFQFKANDNIALGDLMTFSLNGKIRMFDYTGNKEYDEETGLYSFTFPYDNYNPVYSGVGAFHVALMVQDSAGNTAADYCVLYGDQETAEAGFVNLSLDETTVVPATGAVTLYRVFGFAPAGSTVTINGIQTTVEEDDFDLPLPLALGENTVDVLIQDADGETLLSGTANLYAATENDFPYFSVPVLGNGFKATATSAGDVLILDKNYPDGTVIPITIKLSHTNNLAVTGNKAPVTPDENGYVTFDVTLKDGYASFAVKATLGSNASNGSNDSLYRVFAGYIYTPDAAEVQANDPYSPISLVPFYTPEVWYLNTFAGVTPENLNADGTYTVSGCLYNPVDKLTVCGKEATVNADDLTWSCDITLREGFNLVPVVAEKDGVEYPAIGQRILYQTSGPVLDFNVKDGDVLFLDSSEFVLDGAVTTHLDDAQVYLNGTKIMGAQDYGHAYGQETITRDLEYTIQLQPGNNYCTLTAYNYLGLTTTIRFNLYYGHCEHENTELRDAKQATCTEDGYTGDTVCTICGELLEKGEVIPASHTPELVNAKKATCTEDGYTGDTVCAVCGELLEKGEVVPASHTPKLVNAKQATCTEDGYTGDTVCAVCGELLEKGEVIPASNKCASKNFSDLDLDRWYHVYTDYVLDNGLMNGMDKDIFAPNTTLNRGMLVTTLYRLAGEPEVTGKSTFQDVPDGRYFSKAVAWAQANGIVKGITEDTFCPANPVTREQAATFLYRYVTEYLKQTPAKGADLSQYTDVGKISPFARTAMAWATTEGFLQGYGDGTVGPQNTTTRAQMAKFLTILDQNF